MARFPRREADVAALAGTMVFGLAEHRSELGERTPSPTTPTRVRYATKPSPVIATSPVLTGLFQSE